MSKVIKRNASLKELFDSEKSYIQDLKIWQINLRREIINMPGFVYKKKYDICDSLFINMEKIFNLHKTIFSSMKKNNLKAGSFPLKKEDKKRKKEEITQENQKISNSANSSDINTPEEDDSSSNEFENYLDINNDNSILEYASCFLENIKDFNLYEEYIAHLPKAIHEYELLMRNNKEFKILIENFMKNNNIESLGVKNFFFRPNSKLTRYPLLLKAIIKREKNERFKSLYQELVDKISIITKHVDHVSKMRNDYYKVFLLSKYFVTSRSMDSQFFLGLILKNTKLIKDTKLIVKKSNLDPASYKHVFLFNDFLLITQTFENNFSPIFIDETPIFLSKLITIKKRFGLFGKGENLNKLHPIFLILKGKNDMKALYFEDEITRDMFYDQINTAIAKKKKNYRNKLKLKRANNEFEIKDLICVAASNQKIGNLQDFYVDCYQQETIFENTTKTTAFENKNSKSSSSSHFSREIKDNSESEFNKINEEDFIDRMDFQYSSETEDSEISELSSHSWKDIFKNDGEMQAFLQKNDFFEKNKMMENIQTDTLDSSDEKEMESNGCINFCKNALLKNSIYLNNISFSKPESNFSEAYKKIQNSLVFYSNSEGIFVKFRKYEDVDYEDREDFFSSGEISNVISNGRNQQQRHDSSMAESKPKNSLRVNKIIYDYLSNQDNSFSMIQSNNTFSEMHSSFNETSNTYYSMPRVPNTNEKLFYHQNEEIIFFESKDHFNFSKISNLPAKKIIYDNDNEVLYYLSGSYLYTSKYNYKSSKLENQRIDIKIDDFFLDKMKDQIIIALTHKGDYSFSVVYLIDFNQGVEANTLLLNRSLYVGYQIYSIGFLDKVLIISCKDFELVDVQTLKTQELIQNNNTGTFILLNSIQNMSARKIFKIEEDTFLLCFDGVGFYISSLGEFKYTHIIFSWECQANDFKVYKNYVACLDKFFLTLFDLKTGKLISCWECKNMKFVYGVKGLFIHDEQFIYKIEDSFYDEYSGTSQEIESEEGILDWMSQEYFSLISNQTNEKIPLQEKKVQPLEEKDQKRQANSIIHPNNKPKEKEKPKLKKPETEFAKKVEKLIFEINKSNKYRNLAANRYELPEDIQVFKRHPIKNYMKEKILENLEKPANVISFSMCSESECEKEIEENEKLVEQEKEDDFLKKEPDYKRDDAVFQEERVFSKNNNKNSHESNEEIVERHDLSSIIRIVEEENSFNKFENTEFKKATKAQDLTKSEESIERSSETISTLSILDVILGYESDE